MHYSYITDFVVHIDLKDQKPTRWRCGRWHTSLLYATEANKRPFNQSI